jgi:2-amino-4-hydroxy-6-hydroxymethyldihydropteridine diphosphokinase
MRSAARRIRQLFQNVSVSSLYETSPVGFQNQPAFLNAVVAAEAPDDPREVHRLVREIEADLGRRRTFANAPRTIDIDILLLDDTIITEPNLQIPHPRMHGRAFVLVPLAEIAPDLTHPALSRTITELLDDLGDTSNAVWPVMGPEWIDQNA